MSRYPWFALLALVLIVPFVLFALNENVAASPTAQIITAPAIAAELLWSADSLQTEGVLTFVSPDGRLLEHSFDAGSNPFAAVADRAPLADGKYSWEIRLMPTLDADTMATLQALGRASAENRTATVAQLQASGHLPDPATLIQTGGFTILDGRLVDADLVEEATTIRNNAPLAPATANNTSQLSPSEQQMAGDLIVDGSACIGLDCVNGEAFGFDTLRVKENNLRLNFQDTSASASFPSSDWTIVSNDSNNGGRNYLAFAEDSSNELTFVISAGAGANALYVGADGKIGFGTSTPATSLHMTDGDTPTIRLDQDGSVGFAQHVWNISGNEVGFTVQDGTNASTPLRIFAGAPDNSFVVDALGNIGMGFITPTVKLEIDGNVRVHGTVTELSDRRSKENINAVDTQQLLQQLLNIPVYQWNYIRDSAENQHIGPMAQDVFAQTGIGTDTTLASLDVNGMLIASVQALNAEIGTRDATITALENDNAALEARLDQLEAAVNQLLAEEK